MTKTVLVTGATDGIGYETARQLAALGWRVLVHGRDVGKSAAAMRRIAQSVPDAAGAPVAGDFTRMREVVSLAADVSNQAPALDALINNAGVCESRRLITEDGLERTLAVNHFAHFLLTHHLLHALKRAPQGRIITVSSMAHSGGHIDVDDLSLAHRYTGYGAYSTSKLANILFTVALAKRLAGTRATANSLHPGVIATKLLRAGWGGGGAPPASGARTSVYLATAPEASAITGKYFADCRPATPSRAARDEQLAEALWQATERALAHFL